MIHSHHSWAKWAALVLLVFTLLMSSRVDSTTLGWVDGKSGVGLLETFMVHETKRDS